MAARLKNKKKPRVNHEPRSAHGRAVKKIMSPDNFLYYSSNNCRSLLYTYNAYYFPLHWNWPKIKSKIRQNKAEKYGSGLPEFILFFYTVFVLYIVAIAAWNLQLYNIK